jgi:hypothetical protein
LVEEEIDVAQRNVEWFDRWHLRSPRGFTTLDRVPKKPLLLSTLVSHCNQGSLLKRQPFVKNGRMR